MGALFQDRLADWPLVVIWDSDSEFKSVYIRKRENYIRTAEELVSKEINQP
jgi:hypothetical protein